MFQDIRKHQYLSAIFMILMALSNTSILLPDSYCIENVKKYEIIDSKIDNSSIRKALINKDILVNRTIPREELRNLLTIVADLGATEIRHYPQPVKQVSIYAYASKNEYNSNKGEWIGKLFWVVGDSAKQIDISESKYKAINAEKTLTPAQLTANAENYHGVVGPNGEFLTKAILPFERKVYDAVESEFNSNPEPKREQYRSDDDWINACDAIDAKCIKTVAEKYDISEETVRQIKAKVEFSRY